MAEEELNEDGGEDENPDASKLSKREKKKMAKEAAAAEKAAAAAAEADSDSDDSGDPKGKKGKKEKKEKLPKAEGEKSGAGGIILIMLLVLVILIGGFSATLYFDMFSSRTIIANVLTEPLLDVVIWLDPGFSSVRQRMITEEEEFDQRMIAQAEDFDRREADMALREENLTVREELVERQTIDLDRREEQVLAMYERTIPLHRREMTEEEMEDMLQISTLYTQMSPEDAALRLVQLHDRRDVAGILYFMSERNAAAILAVMEARYAADITEILLYS